MVSALAKLELRYDGAKPRRWDFPIFTEPMEYAVTNRKSILIVGGDKGGTGKSTVSRALVDYLEKHSVPIRAFDTEPGDIGVLKRFYPAATMLSGNAVAGQQEIIDGASSSAVTLVDGRAGLLGPMLKSFDRIRLMDDVRSGELQLIVVHVIGQSVASASEVPAVVAAMEGASLVRVRNHAGPDVVFPRASAGNMAEIDVPYLDEKAYAAVDRASVGFAAFVKNTAQSRVLRGEVRAWLDDVHGAFDRAGVAAMLKAA
jgi:hypothetical protein